MVIRSTAHILPSSDSSDVESRLTLVEQLLATEDPALVARRGLEWLAKYAGTRQAVCLLLDEKEQRLVPAGGLGVPTSRLDDACVWLEETDHPLVQLLT